MIKSLLKYLAVGLLVTTASCSNEFDLRQQENGPDAQGKLLFRCADMLEVYKSPDNYATRAGGPKSPKEKVINTLHVFFFDYSSGELLQPGPQNFSSYQKLNLTTPGNQAYITIPTGEGSDNLFLDNDYSSVRIVAIANIDATDEADSPADVANSFYTPYSADGKIQENGRSAGGEPLYITNYSQLQKWVYFPRIRMSEDGSYGDISQLPEAGMPMIGESDGPVDLTQKPANAIVVNMRALMAKVNVSVELDPEQFTDDLPTLTINEYGVMNMPVAVPFEEPQGGLREGKSWTKTDPDNLDADGGYFKTYDVTTQPMFHKGDTPSDWQHNACPVEAHEFTTIIDPQTINKDAAPITFSYYTYENVNMPNYCAKRANDSNAFLETTTENGFIPNYPAGIGEADYQRWKPTMAYENRASALILKGSYTTHQGLTYQAQFTIYLGRDTDIDFQVKRNYCYDNNIVIKGLEYVRNSTDEVYTFDGRVNLKYDNPLYLAVVEERHVDAHATALPVDVWLMNYEDFTPEPENYYTEVTFKIPDDNTNSGGNPRQWMQMVMIPRSEMESPDGRFYAGTGAEKYFYNNLLEDIRTRPEVVLHGGQDGAYEGHQEGAQCGSEIKVKCSPGENGNNSRSRIYFYIDENVGEIGNGNDRSVDVEVKYYAYILNPDGSKSDEVTYTRFLTIEQRGLLRVEQAWKGNPSTDFWGRDNTPTATIPETYIEYYEEYLDHNDPLEEHETGDVYEDGLEWGLNGVTISPSFEDSSDVGTSGFLTRVNYTNVYYKNSAQKMTKWVIDNTKSSHPISDVHLFNIRKAPASAFHYCYGKNKRDYDGSVVGMNNLNSNEKGWYMPGIRELEKALMQYYSTFSDFQGNLYWSCAPSSSNNYARSTKVTVITNDNGLPEGRYVESGAAANDGYQPRIYQAGQKKGLDENGNENKYGIHRIRTFYRKN